MLICLTLYLFCVFQIIKTSTYFIEQFGVDSPPQSLQVVDLPAVVEIASVGCGVVRPPTSHPGHLPGHHIGAGLQGRRLLRSLASAGLLGRHIEGVQHVGESEAVQLAGDVLHLPVVAVLLL